MVKNYYRIVAFITTNVSIFAVLFRLIKNKCLVSMFQKTILKWQFLLVFIFVASSAIANNIKGGLKGVVVDETGKPLKGVTVVMQPDYKKAVTDAQGRFSFTGKLYAGTYTLNINAI